MTHDTTGVGQRAPMSQERAALVVDSCHRELAQLAEIAPEYYDVFERTDPEMCTQDELLWLIENAPAQAQLVKGFLFGILTVRKNIADYTGRPMN